MLKMLQIQFLVLHSRFTIHVADIAVFMRKCFLWHMKAVNK